MTTDRIGDWMQTYTGKQFWPLDPRPEEIDILDIASALSKICRFGGHTRRFYSVAQHSCIVADILLERGYSNDVAFGGLMHDSAEAYIGDIIRPLKRQESFAFYNAAESTLLGQIQQRFHLVIDWAAVNVADNIALATEKRDVMGPAPAAWVPMPDPRHYPIVPTQSGTAEIDFLSRFRYFYKGDAQG